MWVLAWTSWVSECFAASRKSCYLLFSRDEGGCCINLNEGWCRYLSVDVPCLLSSMAMCGRLFMETSLHFASSSSSRQDPAAIMPYAPLAPEASGKDSRPLVDVYIRVRAGANSNVCRTVLTYSVSRLPYSMCMHGYTDAQTVLPNATAPQHLRLQHQAACRLQLHLQGPGKTCLSPREASSAGQTDPIDSGRLDST